MGKAAPRGSPAARGLIVGKRPAPPANRGAGKTRARSSPARSATPVRRGPPVASLDRERVLWTSGAGRVVGVDEVGVGPLCAAVVAAAVLLPAGVDPTTLTGVRDSKRVATVKAREVLATRVHGVAVRVALGAASPREIDRLNVRGATALAMRRALARLGEYDHALMDGRPLPGFDTARHTFVVGGDGCCLSVACASIVAKVVRDRLMRLLGARYQAYGWEHNAGYATADHLAALRLHGPTPHHRALYRPVLQAQLDLFGNPDEQ